MKVAIDMNPKLRKPRVTLQAETEQEADLLESMGGFEHITFRLVLEAEPEKTKQ